MYTARSGVQYPFPDSVLWIANVGLSFFVSKFGHMFDSSCNCHLTLVFADCVILVNSDGSEFVVWIIVSVC